MKESCWYRHTDSFVRNVSLLDLHKISQNYVQEKFFETY